MREESKFSHGMSVDEIETLLTVQWPLFSKFTYLGLDFVVIRHKEPWMNCEYVDYQGVFRQKYFSFEIMNSFTKPEE